MINPRRHPLGRHRRNKMKDFAPNYTVNGIQLQELDMPFPTSRCLPYNPDGNLFEMAASAIDKDGNKYVVTWLFEDNGEESYDMYDYSQPDDCRLID